MRQPDRSVGLGVVIARSNFSRTAVASHSNRCRIAVVSIALESSSSTPLSSSVIATRHARAPARHFSMSITDVPRVRFKPTGGSWDKHLAAAKLSPHRGVTRVAKATRRKNYTAKATYSIYNIDIALNCTQSFNGGETPRMSYATNPPIWHPLHVALKQLLTDLPPLQHEYLTF